MPCIVIHVFAALGCISLTDVIPVWLHIDLVVCIHFLKMSGISRSRYLDLAYLGLAKERFTVQSCAFL